MGRCCRICGRQRAAEKFGGKGYSAFVCRDCRALPKAEQSRIPATDEVWGFLAQTNISATNIARLESLASIDDAAFQELRTLVLEIARVRPRRRNRWENIWNEHRHLYRRAIAAGWFSEYDLDEQPNHFEMPRGVDEEDDWDSPDTESRRQIPEHNRRFSNDESSLNE